MDDIKTKSTSKQSAKCTPLVLRETKTTRIIFHPLLVDNPHNKNASVKGVFVCQRKGSSDIWKDENKITLSNLKKNERFILNFHSSELHKFYQRITDLYSVFSQHGIPLGRHTFIDVKKSLNHLIHLKDKDIEKIKELGMQALQRLLTWANKQNNLSNILDKLEESEENILKDFLYTAGLRTLKKAINEWKTNINKYNEEFWQKKLLEYPIVLEQLFAYPIVIVSGKAYVGGKRFDNKGGSIVDYLAKNKSTHNAVIVEIKTPQTCLLSTEYRKGIFNLSKDLIGSVMQVVHYRKKLCQKLDSLNADSDIFVESCEPPCIVIIGNSRKELVTKNKRKSFELFRRQFPGVEIITYDELIGRTDRLIYLLENS